MAQVKLHLDRRYCNAKGTYPVVIQLSHKGKTRTIPVGLRLEDNQWNDKSRTVCQLTNTKRQQAKLNTLISKAVLFIENNRLTVRAMSIGELKTELTILIEGTRKTSVETEYHVRHSKSTEGTLMNWGNVLINRALASNRIGKANYYKPSISAFVKFNGGNDLPLADINEQFLEEFKVYAEMEIPGVKRRWKPNTTGAYMRAVRAIINQSVREKRNYVPADFQPFRNVGIPSETKEVDSITSNDIAKLRGLKLEQGTGLWKSRARFLFMFNCQGMNFVDLAKLRVSDRVGNYVSYERTKTIRKKKNKRIEVGLTAEASEIWNFFANGKTPNNRAFDIFDVREVNNGIRNMNLQTRSEVPGVTERNRLKRALKKQNKDLGVLSEMARLHKRITTYDARYGWVNAALDANIPEELIGKGLGHSHPGITRVYFEERHKRSTISVDINERITA